MDLANNFHTRLKNLRTSRNLTQKQITDATGMTVTGYQNYESARRKPNFDAIIALADFFNVSTDYLLGRTDVPQVAKGAAQ